jgi:hypothetical protein
MGQRAGRARVLVPILSLLGALLLSGASGARPLGLRATAPTPPLPSVITTPTVRRFPVRNVQRRYPVYGPRGRLLGRTSWLVTPAGGNCCEDYAAAQPNGRLLVFGGTFPMYSDNRGRTWYEVKPVTPLNNGEGAIVTGPNGEIAGIGWDAYSGDHLQAFRYQPRTRAWKVAEVLLKNPFFDRPWISVARGPFTINGHRYPFVYIVRGGGENKDPELISTDGLTYSQLTSQVLDEMQSAADARRFVPVRHYALADYWAAHPWAGTIPLTAGGLLQITQPNDGDFASCPVSDLEQATSTWSCSAFSPPFLSTWTKTSEVCCQVRQDSRGWLSDVVANSTSTSHRLLYFLSANGGRSWSAPLSLTPPRGGTLEANGLFNVVVNGRLGIAAVSARFDNANSDGQDQVFVVDVAHRRPRLLYTLLLGGGNVRTANDVSGSAGDRMDYASVAILPDGRIVASFDDRTTFLAPETAFTSTEVGNENRYLGHNQPNLAILGRSVLRLFRGRR